MIRVQRMRKRGWQMPDNTVSVTRPGKWGNPFKVGEPLDGLSHVILNRIKLSDQEQESGAITARIAVEAFRIWLLYAYAADDLRNSLYELRGKNLACFCKEGDPCHADVLLELANT